MKKFTIHALAVAAAAVLAVSLAGIAAAAMKDVNKLNAEITMLNADAKLPQAEQVISKELTDKFNIKNDKIDPLLSRNMQYGDVAAVLAFADKMRGGVTDANINQVVNQKQTAAGWDQVAKNLKVDISDVASKLNSIENSAHKNIKQALAESGSFGAGGTGETSGSGGMSSETGTDMSGGATGGTGTDMSGGATGGTGTY